MKADQSQRIAPARNGVSRLRFAASVFLLMGLLLPVPGWPGAPSWSAASVSRGGLEVGWFDGWLPGKSAQGPRGRGGGNGNGDRNRGGDSGNDQAPGRSQTGPVIERVHPAPGEATSEAAAPVTFEVHGSLPFGLMRGVIVPDSLSLKVGGADRTSEARFIPGGLAAWIPWLPAMEGTIRFTPAEPLDDGERRIEVRIDSTSGRTGALGSLLRVDTRPPVVMADSPSEGATIADRSRPLTLTVKDEGVGVDWDTLDVASGPASAIVEPDPESDRVRMVPEDEWPEGELRIEVNVADRLGTGNSTTLTYDVRSDVALAVDVRATPDSGDAPLTVTLTPDVTTNTAIERYRWDFDGDGTIDRNDPIGRAQQHTYDESGTYEPVLTVTDSRGETESATATVDVANAAPEVTASAGPSNGAPPLEVEFTANASDRDGIESFEWDFDGDGVYDRTTDSGSTTYTYTEEGTFQARIRVTDGAGNSTDVAIPGVEVRVIEGAPSVVAEASPASGEVPLEVSFDGSASDPDGHVISEWQWDFDRDGVPDYTSVDSPEVTHTYAGPGTRYPRLTAIATDGDESSDVVRVAVEPALSLSLSSDTIDTGIGETVTVESSLSGDTRVSLVVEDRAGRVVRTIVPWHERVAGDYSDNWDGTAGDGRPVSEGEYRIVLLYEVDGVEHRLDLAGTTGGDEYNPSRSRLPNRFSPFAGDPLEIDFTLREASRVTAFMGRFNVNTRLVTFYQREPLGRGTHTIVWNGTDAEGQLIHPPAGDSFLFGIFAFTLPDNAVYVRSGVHVTDLSSGPPILVPGEVNDGDGPPAVDVEFELSRAGDIEFTVFDAETGTFVDRRRYEGLDAGENRIEWDGRTSAGEFVAPGRYRLGVSGIDERGSATPSVYTVQRVYY